MLPVENSSFYDRFLIILICPESLGGWGAGFLCCAGEPSPRLATGEEISLNTVLRRIGMAFFVGSSLVMAGCSGDNEAEADKLQAKLGPSPKSDVKAVNEVPPPAGSMDEYVKRHAQEESADKKKSEYAKSVQ